MIHHKNAHKILHVPVLKRRCQKGHKNRNQKERRNWCCQHDLVFWFLVCILETLDHVQSIKKNVLTLLADLEEENMFLSEHRFDSIFYLSFRFFVCFIFLFFSVCWGREGKERGLVSIWYILSNSSHTFDQVLIEHCWNFWWNCSVQSWFFWWPSKLNTTVSISMKCPSNSG